ncbi:MAG: ABC transporter ATP-binding protein [Corallococcus sp.]|nr:ABC transporter ATP-binding protein [Corallococcus sp.]MCM1359609.1 ABC transporter ATP-binding protein [Corallococcus sp.]MCM1395201.1 ABC transporter ATP-binding protein [Corallococcus sp.]
MITLQNVSVNYGDNVVYENFSYSFGEGVNVVLGKSGCGKTTLLNVIAGLVDYDGDCRKDGQAALVFQNPCLAPVSVWKNVDLVLPKGGNARDIESALAMTELLDKRNRYAPRLSGGEQQRVSLARAFASGRNVLLMDEPFSNLDYGTKFQLRIVLDKMLSVVQKTVLFVTHDIDDAIALADRIYVLQGRPATMTLEAEINAPRSERRDTDAQSLQIRSQLQTLLK